jgi:hypothetical protein
LTTRLLQSSALALAAILYCAVQWKYAASMGPHTIFSSSRTTDRADFAGMVDRLSKAIQGACSANPSSELLFDDGDSALPYLKISDDRLSGCVTVRNTNVTPFSRLEMDDCNVVFVREHNPSDKSILQIYDTLHPRPWIETERWMSSDGRFGFALYRHECFPNQDGDVIQK